MPLTKLQFSVDIHAPRRKVWDAIPQPATYRDWTSAFGPGSHFLGSWDEGSDMRSPAPGNNGAMEGMVSKIVANRKYEF